jgi:hypothetical protein
MRRGDMTARPGLQWSPGAAGPVFGRQEQADLSWMGSGLCAQMGPASWDDAEDPQGTCAGCPVRGTCLRFALDSGQEWGVWGGVLFEHGRPLDPGLRDSYERPARPVSVRCVNDHRRTTANTHVDSEGAIRCRDCSREKDARQRQRRKELQEAVAA